MSTSSLPYAACRQLVHRDLFVLVDWPEFREAELPALQRDPLE